jgi:hypothetical protein
MKHFTTDDKPLTFNQCVFALASIQTPAERDNILWFIDFSYQQGKLSFKQQEALTDICARLNIEGAEPLYTAHKNYI